MPFLGERLLKLGRVGFLGEEFIERGIQLFLEGVVKRARGGEHPGLSICGPKILDHSSPTSRPVL